MIEYYGESLEIETDDPLNECPIKVSTGDMKFPDVNFIPKEEPIKKKRKTTKSSSTDEEDSTEVSKSVKSYFANGEETKPAIANNTEVIPGRNQTYLNTGISYHQSYDETDILLRNSIAQLDMVAGQLQEDLTSLRSSKTIRNKYSYISDLTSSLISAINGKINATKEVNASINNSHKLDLQRMKELKLNEENDDTKDIMDVYRAFVSQPLSANMAGMPLQNPFGPTTMDLTLGAVPGAIVGDPMRIAMMGQSPTYANRNNLSPEQMTMMIEENPNMKHVITYDPNTGDANFAVYDSSTNSFLPGVRTLSKEMFMPGMEFDWKTNTAHSNDLNQSYDIIFVNSSNVPFPTANMGNTNGGQDMSDF